MHLNKIKREELRMKFGGKCAYCGCDLDGKWHADHAEPVERESVIEKLPDWRVRFRKTGRMAHPENDRWENLYPACVPCNILKSSANIEAFRAILSYFAHSIPRIKTYSHVHHLMRFNRLQIDTSPVIFWFEQFEAKEPSNDR